MILSGGSIITPKIIFAQKSQHEAYMGTEFNCNKYLVYIERLGEGKILNEQ
jgi:hypothetical protein